jgi:hypothetical protein
MKNIVLILSILLSFGAHASSTCYKVVSDYETKDIMYVICSDLSSLSEEEASDLIIRLFNQYKGLPDEVAIYFVASAELVGKASPEGNELVGFYYSHNSKLEIWPNSESSKKVIEITWK